MKEKEEKKEEKEVIHVEGMASDGVAGNDEPVQGPDESPEEGPEVLWMQDTLTGMKRYIGRKIIDAVSMDRNRFFELTGEDKRSKDNEEGYLVIYEDGYRSWSPKDVFEKAYHELLIVHAENIIDNASVFPSDERTVAVAKDDDPDYGGAHRYQFWNCLGFNNGMTEYVDSFQEIQFIKKADDGSITPGLQSEQLLLALIDRHRKLNAKFPSEHGEKAIEAMETALGFLELRVRERMDRGVMGDLKK